VSFYRFIDAEKANYPVRLLCRVLSVSRAAYYAWRAQQQPSERQQQDAQLSVHLRASWRRSRQTYGSPRLTAELKALGFRVGRRRVARLMRAAGLSGRPRPRFVRTTDSAHAQPVADNLLQRHFTTEAPNQAWVGDITYLPTQNGWVYLAVLLDLFSRKVVGWAVDTHMREELCLEALRKAVALRQPGPGLIHHTDRGSQYTSTAYQHALAQLQARPSMSRRANCWDNAVAESFFGTLEQELGADADWADVREARAAVENYISTFYNLVRRHSTLDFQSPVDFERSFWAQHPQVA
jgi:putative transposase